MFLCSFKDPGRVPKNHNQRSRLRKIPLFGDKIENEEEIEFYHKKDIKFSQGNYYLKIKYCTTCNVFLKRFIDLLECLIVIFVIIV